MRIYDVSVTLRERMAIYPGDEGFSLKAVSTISQGASANVSLLRMGTHTGTHVDAPHHMLEGAETIERVPPAAFVGPVEVIEVAGSDSIRPEHLRGYDWQSIERVLFKTDNGAKLDAYDGFFEDFVYLSGEAAQFLARQGLALLGVDYLSVDRFHSGTHAAHLALLRAGVVIIEGLNLSDVPPGRYEIFCGPLKLAGGDGAPARVFLLDRRES